MKKKITFFLTMLISMVGLSASAQDIEVKNADDVTISYNYINNKTELAVTSSFYSNEYTGNVVIPESVTYNNKTYSVTSIDSYAFEGCSGLTSITIPNSITSIGYSAFKNCSGLTSITIPNSVTSIGYFAFQNTNLKSVTIGTGVLSISYGAFEPKPVKVIWLTNTPPNGYEEAEGTVNYVANELYTFLSNKTVYPFLSSMFEVDGIKYVPVSPSERTCDAIDCAYNSSAENITINSTVNNKGISLSLKQIQRYVCYGNLFIKNVTIESDYTGNVPYEAFSGCEEIQTATVSNNGNIEEIAFYGCTALQTATISNNGDIGSRAFYGCTALQTATISNNGDIGSRAFEGSMTSSPATVYLYNKGNINENAFYGCTALQTVTFGDEIPSVGNSAFYNCRALQSIVIPDATTSLGTYVFSGCSMMTSTKIGSGVASIPTYAFSGCSALNDMQIGQNVQTIDEYAFYRCRALKSITIPKSVTDINDNVFFGCTGLKNVTMEDRMDDTVLAFGYNSGSNTALFSDCPLDEVYIGRNISYSKSPFYRNTSLRSVTITDRETEISPTEFYGCTNLKEVKIGDGVTTIGNRAFSGCSSLDFFSFGSAVQTIGPEAFSDCTAMTKLISKAANPPTCGTQALDDINKWSCKLLVPAHSMSLYQAAPQWKEFFFIEEATGIKGITGDNTSSKATITTSYDLNGKQFSQPQKGLNILKMSDGTTRKVMK